MRKSTRLDPQRLAAAVPTRVIATVGDVLSEVHERITRRAFELFERHGVCGARALDDWLAAERELFWRPPVTVVERDGTVAVEIAMPGFTPEDVDIQMTEHQIVVRSERTRAATTDEDRVHLDELPHGCAFRCIELSSRLDPKAARATLRDGILRIEVPVAAAREPTVAVPVESGTRLTA